GASALISSAALAQAPAAPTAPAAVAPDQLPTPRDAAGHPVLAGMWNGTAPNAAGGLGGIVGVACISDRPNCKPSDFIDFQSRTGTWLGYEEDNRINRRNGTNKPLYKPEFWEVVQDNDTWANWRDPVNFCLPYGVPRSGAPTQIL